MCLPNDVVNSGRSMLVTTKPPSSMINEVCIGNFHVGASTVWYICVPEPDPVPRPIDEYNEVHCMICLETPPNTMVMPCGHVAVCEQCSHHLTQTGDAYICVKCRRPIEEVIYPTDGYD